jgi:radical SAM protein with 4Fe4S-binding SPASM domain
MDPKAIEACEAGRGLDAHPFRSACYAPYTSLYFNTNGDVIACCKNTTYVLGNIATERLPEVWHGNRTKALRKALERYKFGLGCEFCEWQIGAGQYDQVYTKTFDRLPVASSDPEWPQMLEFTISNTCNLACIMCYGVLSSTIRANREKLPPLPKVYDDQFFTDLRQFLPHLKVAKFFGGEPFLAQENFRVWDMMIEDRLQLPIHVTTNGTHYNPDVERVLEAFPTSLSISIDGATKQTVESIRVNARHDRLIENVHKFHAYTKRRGTQLTLTYCLMRQNWHEFGDYLRFAEELGLLVFINTVIDPTDCSLYTLPPQELADIVARMQQMDRSAGYSRFAINGQVWRSGVSVLQQSASERQVQGVDELKKSAHARKELLRPNHVNRAWKLVAEGRFADALGEVELVGAEDADHYQAVVLQGYCLRRMERLVEAEERIEQAMTIWRRAPNAYLELAWLRFQQARHDEALAAAEKARSMLGGDDSHEAEAGICDALAMIHSALGQHPQALAAANRLNQLRPTSNQARVHRGWVYAAMGSHAEALADAEAALQIDANDGEAMSLKRDMEKGLSRM